MATKRWPQVAAPHRNMRQHAATLQKEIEAVIAHGTSLKTRPNGWETTEAVLKSMQTYLDKTMEEPSLGDISKRMSTMEHLLTRVETLAKKQVESSSAHATARASKGPISWAHRVASAPPPPSYISPPSTFMASSTSGSQEIDAPGDRKVVIKLIHKPTIEELRNRTPVQITERASRGITRAGMTARITAAKQLKSGDVKLTTATAADAETLRCSTVWATFFGHGAYAVPRSFGVIAHGVPTTVRMSRQEDVIQQIETNNREWNPRLKVTYVGWLNKNMSIKKKASSMVVECTAPEAANLLIQREMLFEGQALRCELYNRNCRRKQCFNCHTYGHIAAQCTAEQRCEFCAERHSGLDCPVRTEESKHKCASCGGKHRAFDKKCPNYIAETERISQAILNSPNYWPVNSPTASLESVSISSGASKPGPGPRPGPANSSQDAQGTQETSSARSAPANGQQTQQPPLPKPQQQPQRQQPQRQQPPPQRQRQLPQRLQPPPKKQQPPQQRAPQPQGPQKSRGARSQSRPRPRETAAEATIDLTRESPASGAPGAAPETLTAARRQNAPTSPASSDPSYRPPHASVKLKAPVPTRRRAQSDPSSSPSTRTHEDHQQPPAATQPAGSAGRRPSGAAGLLTSVAVPRSLDLAPPSSAPAASTSAPATEAASTTPSAPKRGRSTSHKAATSAEVQGPLPTMAIGESGKRRKTYKKGRTSAAPATPATAASTAASAAVSSDMEVDPDYHKHKDRVVLGDISSNSSSGRRVQLKAKRPRAADYMDAEDGSEDELSWNPVASRSSRRSSRRSIADRHQDDHMSGVE